MSIRRERACAGVATEKGFGAEGRLARGRSWHCEEYSLCCRRNAESYPNHVKFTAFWWLCGQEYALWRTPAFYVEKRIVFHQKEHSFMSEKPIVPINCFFQGCYNPAYEEQIRIGKEKCHRYNQLSPNARDEQSAILEKLLGRMGKEVILVPPFWCDYGYNITVGDFFYANHNLVIQDGASVRFGDNVFIGPNCTLTTAEHAIDPELRKAGVEIAKPIKIGNNVWIGANSVILAGVEIGDNTVIGAGSVVTKSIPANVVAVGVPCRVMREITEADKTAYPFYQTEL